MSPDSEKHNAGRCANGDLAPHAEDHGPIHAAFHRPRTRIYRVAQTVVWVLILTSVALLAVEATLDLSPEMRRRLEAFDRWILAVFAVELLLRVGSYHPPTLDIFDLSFAERLRTHIRARLRFVLRPLILIDILTVAAVVPALRGLRALRLLRLFRTTRIFRYADPFHGLERAIHDNALLFSFALSILAASVLLGGLTLYLVEVRVNDAVDSLGDGLWWAIVTLTTVGFGDISPVTTVGRVVGGVLMVAGLFNLALFAGIVGHTLLNAVLTIRKEQFRMSGYSDHVVICGYAAGARMLLDILMAELDPSTTPLVVFAEGERPADLPPDFQWVSGDATKESELDKVRMTHARAAILVGLRGERPQEADAITILTAFTIRSYMRSRAGQRRRPLYIAAEILDSENVGHAHAAGVDEVIETTRLGFSLIAHALTMPGTAELMAEVATKGIQEIFIGRAPPEIDLPAPFAEVVARVKERTGALVIGVRDGASGQDEINPPADRSIDGSAELVYLAEGPILART
ncbi:MAG: ion transporter [Gemmatimonadota bacterium]